MELIGPLSDRADTRMGYYLLNAPHIYVCTTVSGRCAAFCSTCSKFAQGFDLFDKMKDCNYMTDNACCMYHLSIHRICFQLYAHIHNCPMTQAGLEVALGEAFDSIIEDIKNKLHSTLNKKGK